jgi:hypothetical protein
MKKLLFAILLGLPLIVSGQEASPMWMDDLYRKTNYPTDVWYTGFAHDRLKEGADVAAALKAVELDARNRLSESIIVTVESVSQVGNSSSQTFADGRQTEVITTEYQQAIKTATSATTVHTDIESFYNPTTNDIYALAAVKRVDLRAFYIRQIDLDLNNVGMAIELSGQLVASGKKMSARRKIEEAKQMLQNVEALSNLSIAVDARIGDGELQVARAKNLRQTVEQLLIDLEQSTMVWVDSSGDATGIFSDIIKQALSENGCSIVDVRDEADYELTLSTSSTQRSGGTGPYAVLSYYANVEGSLFNRLTNKNVASFSILNDPAAYSAGRSAEDAIAKAFRLPSLRDKVLEKIMARIKN